MAGWAGCIHTDKPLGGGAVNHRRFVAPAMWVAVGDVVGGKQPAVLAQFVYHQWCSFPDVQAAKKWQLVNIAAIALDWVEYVFVGNAIGDAGVKVFYPVSG